jgi:hypothetical protein
VGKSYEAWRISYQSGEQAAQAAWGHATQLRQRVDELEKREATLESALRAVLAVFAKEYLSLTDGEYGTIHNWPQVRHARALLRHNEPKGAPS